MRKLNMWHRLGIVATALWLAIFPVWRAYAYLGKEFESVQSMRQNCINVVIRTKANVDCAVYIVPDGVFAGAWQIELTRAAIWAVIAWILAFATYYVCRWVLAGRTASSN